MAPRSEAEPPVSQARASHPHVAILGCGAVGTALAAALAHERVPLALWSRTAGRAAALAARIESEFPDAPAVQLPERATSALETHETSHREPRWSFLCVTDTALADFVKELARDLASTPGAREGLAVLHTHGASGLKVLAPLAALGFGAAKLHPLVALPPGTVSLQVAAQALRGAWFATSAGPGAEGVVTRLLGVLQGRRLAIAGDDKASLGVHAAAALLAGGVVALFDAALRSRPSGSGETASFEAALLGLLESTTANLGRVGVAASLTGPTARGAVKVVEAHLAALGEVDPELALAYRVLARRMLALGLERGTVKPAVGDELDRLLGS